MEPVCIITGSYNKKLILSKLDHGYQNASSRITTSIRLFI
jgi:hypothetical protein